MSHPFRPLFVEVPREPPKPSRGGVLDMTALAPILKALYPTPPLSTRQYRGPQRD